MAETSYLSQLRFDQKLKNSFIAKYLSNPRFVLLFLLTIIVMGIQSFTSLPRQLNPDIDIPIVIVSTVLPGANPSDIETLITEPLETGITGVENVEKITSTSQENLSLVQVEFSADVEADKARADVQTAVETVSLPDDALQPKVQKIDFENFPVWTFVVTGKGDVASLTEFSKQLQQDLEDISTIKQVQVSGLEEQEISVVINQETALNNNINPALLSQTVQTALRSYPAGSVTSNTSNYAISIDPSLTSIEDVRSLPLQVNGVLVSLGEIATITQRSKPNQFPSYYATNEQPAEQSVTFSIYKSDTANIGDSVTDAEKVIEASLTHYEGQFSFHTISNSAEDTEEQFDHLIRDFLITIVLVFIVLFVFLGARQAFVSFFSVPLTFLISFTVMNAMGISLNFLSTFSLLLSLGLLVDDTIVVISAMTQYYKSGKFTPLETGLMVWKDFLVAILTTTLTTVWAFLPLLISGGIIGEFIKSIPIVVSSTLIASFIIAMFIILPLMIIILRPQFPTRVVILLRILLILFLIGLYIALLPKGVFMIAALIALVVFLFVTANVRLLMVKQSKAYLSQQQKTHTIFKNAPTYLDKGFISFNTIGKKYRSLMNRILATKQNRRRAILFVVIFSLFSYLLVPLGFVKNEFFPKTEADSFTVSVELPAGTNLKVANQRTQELLEEIRKSENVSYVTAEIGGSSASGLSFGGGRESNVLAFSVVLPEEKERVRDSIETAQLFREKFATYPYGTVTVSEVSGGPPAGADIQINLFGEDLQKLDQYANEIVTYLENNSGVTDVTKSIKEGTGKLVFVPNQQALTTNGVSRDQLGLSLRTFASGFTLDTVKFEENNDENRDISLRFTTEIPRIEDVYELSIPTQSGVVPLASLGKLSLEASPTRITREDGKRTLSVTATVTAGNSVTGINQQLEEFANTKLRMEEGYSWSTGGVNEENQNSVNSIFQAMLISFLLIIVTLVIQFGSFRRAIIVMLVIPLSISGVFVIFALTGTALSFPALIGVLALFGIVVKNSILIVDKIIANQKAGMEFTNSIVDATESRLEPIALTSIATIFGLIPITISDPLWRGLGGAIIAGLTFSGTIMLFFIPVVYYVWFNPSSERKTTRRSKQATTLRKN